MPDVNDAKRSKLSRAIVGAFALLILPALLMIDTLVASSRGWRADSPLIIQAAMMAAVAVAVVVLFAFVIPPLRRAMARHAGHLVLLVSGGLAGWLIAEAGLSYVFRLPAFHRRSPGLVLDFNPDPFEMYKVSGEDTRTTYNSLGIRGKELPPRDDAYRILAIGGSTTECLYLDDEETWPALLEQQLNRGGGSYWVGNAGHGDLATGHDLRFIRTDPLPAQCDCLLLMVGVNDMMRNLLRLDDGEIAPPLWCRSGSMLLLRDLWNGKLKKGILWDRTGEQLLGVYRRGFPISPWKGGEPKWDPAIEAFTKRIRSIHAAAKDRSIVAVFVSQPVLWDDYLSPDAEKRLCIARVDPYPRHWDYLTAANLRTVMDRYNEALEDTCKEIGAGFIDAALPIDGQEDDFYDDYHLNEEGCGRAAKLMAGWLREHLDTK